MISLKHIVVRLIERYQRAGGGQRLLSVQCNFKPTCSEFTRQAIIDQGTLAGLRLGWQRIRKCNQRDLTEIIHDPYQGESHGPV